MSAQSGIPPTAAERGKVAPAKFAHVVYRTSRFADMVRWYKTTLEARPMMENETFCFLTYDDEHHRVAIVNMPGLADRDPQAAGVEHCAYTYACLDDLLGTYQRLKAEGIEPYWCINHGPTLSMYYRDPDGNQVELQIDIFADNEATNEWFARSDFETNPIGVKFDPEEIIRRHAAGEPCETLLARPVIAPSEVPAQFP